MNKIGTLDIIKAYLGIKELSANNAYIGEIPLLKKQVDDRLRFEARENSTFGLSKKSTFQTILQYSLDDGNTWTDLTTSSNVSLGAGDKAYIRGKLTGNNSYSRYTQFKMTGDIAVKGDIIYLYDYENLPTTLSYTNCFRSLFQSCVGLKDAEEIILNSQNLSDSCYYSMFSGCNNLTTAPTLPAQTLANSCYREMFSSCNNLTTAPTLPAQTLANSCYYRMFYNCTSLTTAPTLPAQTLADSCYSEMFSGCTSLTIAPELQVATLTSYCYYNMFNGCASLNKVISYASDISASNCLTNWCNNVSATGDFYNLGGANYPSGASGIPSGWTVHTSL